MKKSIGSFMIAAAISGTFAANAQAEEIVVKKGDTLWGLSEVHNTSVDNIIGWNGLESETIYAGETLNIFPEKMYEVKNGDTLWGIASSQKVSLQNLIDWNDLKSDLIYPGMQLAIGANTGNVQAVQTQQAPAAKKDTTQVSKPAQPAQPASSKPAAQQQATPAAENPSGKELVVTATAYTASCEGCIGITATGIDLKNNPGAKVIAVDPSVIPLGSKVHVEGYGTAVAGDTGGAIEGNKIDVFIPSKDAALKWGRKSVKVTILD
ncbi:LysM peptidoglycan-binding and 3D domain-containing protein [Bacillus sp. FJAT-27445]|uniref:LysM peptidoglycan-binding and 3D domain-containing protein n=1 Tax=Bacillus sp. FJAT-27445 TaxID=1679166 RepID=UPI00074376B2|nr:3D domain-containing protein [Bacillus sp. FJAT-27445]